MTATRFAAHLFNRHGECSLGHLRPFTCKHSVVIPELERIAGDSAGVLSLRPLGESTEGRSIMMVSCGRGKTPVLLWSQMHGDEPTATLALLDIFSYLSSAVPEEDWIQSMLSDITLHAIPMLNPDGAERMQRQTAVLIDMNRDARAVATPEAKILKAAQRKLSPSFGFNLHDQGLSSVGTSPNVSALAFLAPASDQSRSRPQSRVRAMRVAALMVQSLRQFIDGHMSAYDDTYEPRAFGDGMQSWGTSTVLIESGHWPNDPEKQFIRKLNFVAILSALRGIANHSYQDAELEHYAMLPVNGKTIYHYIIHDLLVEYPGGWSHRVDVGLELEPSKNRPPVDGTTAEPVVTVREIGDLRGFGALESIKAHGRRLTGGTLTLDQSLPLRMVYDLLQMYRGG